MRDRQPGAAVPPDLQLRLDHGCRGRPDPDRHQHAGRREPRNNFLKRALTWNPSGVLNGARHLTIAGTWFYVAADAGIVVARHGPAAAPAVAAVIPLKDARASALQFRYLFVLDAGRARSRRRDPPRPAADRPGRHGAACDAQRLYVARTYAYVAAGSDGLAIVDVERPEQPKL